MSGEKVTIPLDDDDTAEKTMILEDRNAAKRPRLSETHAQAKLKKEEDSDSISSDDSDERFIQKHNETQKSWAEGSKLDTVESFFTIETTHSWLEIIGDCHANNILDVLGRIPIIFASHEKDLKAAFVDAMMIQVEKQHAYVDALKKKAEMIAEVNALMAEDETVAALPTDHESSLPLTVWTKSDLEEMDPSVREILLKREFRILKAHETSKRKMKAETMRIEATLVKLNAATIMRKAKLKERTAESELFGYIYNLNCSLYTARERISTMVGFGPFASSGTGSQTVSKTNSLLDQMMLEAIMDRQAAPIEGRPPALIVDQSLADELLLKAPTDLAGFARFNASLQQTIGDASFIVKNNNTSDKSYNEIIQATLILFRQKLRPYRADNSTENNPGKINFPGPYSTIAGSVQPILLLLLEGLADYVGEDSVTDASDSTMNKPKANVPGTNNQPILVIDKYLEPFSRYEYFSCAGMEIEIVEKPGERKNQGPIKLEAEGIREVSSRLARFLEIAFNLCGYGTNACAKGLYFTPSHIVVVQLELTGMGTKDVKVDWKKSPRLPLLSKENFQKWSMHGRHVDQFRAIGCDLYPENKPPSEIPEGLRVLCAMMRAKRGDLYKTDPSELPAIVDDMIGFGSYGTVYGALDNKNSIIKFPRFGSVAQLQQELSALTELAKDGPYKSRGVPKVVNNPGDSLSMSEFCFRGCTVVKVPFLQLEPRGISCLAALRRDLSICDAANQLYETILYMHEKGVYHTDICPKNIVAVYTPSTAQWQVILIDFGSCSLVVNDIVPGLCGRFTPAFAHDEMIRLYSSPKQLIAKPAHDWASLTYSMAALANNSLRSPWSTCHLSMTYGPGDCWYQERREHTTMILRHVVDGADGMFWKNWPLYIS